MKLGVMTVCLGGETLESTCEYLKGLGVQELELGAGGCPGTAHCNAVELVNDPAGIEKLKSTVEKYGLKISALSVHGNPVHPNKEVAEKDHKDFEAAVLLAEKLGVKTVITFSGCPGDSENAKYPTWSVATWPNDHAEVREWQWNEVLIPYWKKAGAFAKEHGVRVAIEIHPGFCVYNTPTMLKLNEAVGDSVGANFDPSHLFWQGIDPCCAIRELKGMIYHFHAKDTKIDVYNTAKNGCLDTKSFSDFSGRPWLFRTVGYGHSEEVWRNIFSTLQEVGYEGVVSIEHEDALMSQKEGLEKAISFLKNTIIFEDINKDVYWA